MKRLTAELSVFFTLLLFASFAMADEKVQTEMVADVSAITPGRPFTVGIKFIIDPGWHIYWENPGDSGLATRVKLNLPEGFTAGKLKFPVPSRLELPGDIVNYGYENQVMLMVEVTPPKDLLAGKTVSISAKASWLVCQDTCVPGQADVSVDLPVSDTVVAANGDLFKQWSSQLAVTSDGDNIASKTQSVALSNGGGEGNINVVWKKAPSDVAFFPRTLANGEIEKIKSATVNNATNITFKVSDCKGDQPITGLLVYTSAAGVKTGMEISIPVQ